jgi:energy-coupling factor transport system permease protein
MRAFVWHEDDSFLHRLNPLTKLALSVPVAILVSTTQEPVTPLVIALLALLATRVLGRVPWSSLLRPFGFAAVVGFGLFWTSALFYAGPFSPEVVALGPVRLSVSALVYGAAIAARLAAILATSMLFVLTTDPTKLVLALIQQARVSPRVGYSVFAAYRFVPLLAVEFDNIRAAHLIRGGATDRGPLAAVRELIGYAIPLLATAVRKGERVALAMDSRAFGALPRRTYYRETSLGWTDAWFGLGALLALGLAMLARFVV